MLVALGVAASGPLGERLRSRVCDARVRISAFASAPRCHTSAFDHSPTARPTALTLPPTTEAPARAFVPHPPRRPAASSARVSSRGPSRPGARQAPAPSPGLGNSDPLERLWCQERTRERFSLKLCRWLNVPSFPRRACHGPSLAETAVEEPPFFFAPRDVRRCARFPLTPVRAATFRSLPGLRMARASLGTSASGRNLRICCEEEAAEPEAACGTEAPGTSGPSPCGSHRGARAPES